MELNSHLPELPEWPPIRFLNDRNEYIVGGPHASYRRYKVACTLGFLTVLIYTPAALLIVGGAAESGYAGVLFFVLCIPFLFGMTFYFAPGFMCQRLFPRKTLVHFTPQHITVNNKTYDNSPDIQVQFRANRPHLTQEAIDQILKQKRTKSVMHELKFRKIEMIYGSRLIHLTSLADEDRAAQFVIALQLGCDLARSLKTNPSRKMAPTRATEDSLPE